MNSDLICLHMDSYMSYVDSLLPDKSCDHCIALCLGYLECLYRIYHFSQSLYDRYVSEIKDRYDFE